MLFFIPWALLFVAVIVAVPVVVKMSPSTGSTGGDDDAEMDEYADEDEAVLVDDLAADPNEFGAEPIGDDAFAEFN